MLLLNFLSVTCSAALAYMLLSCFIPRLRLELLDQPNARSSHLRPTPRGGGLSFVLISCSASCVAWLLNQSTNVTVIPLFALPLAVVGLLDDKYNLPSTWRFYVQFFTGLLLFSISPLFQPLISFLAFGHFWIFGIFTLLLIFTTAVINFINFMDGLDGLVAGCLFIVFIALAIELSAPWSLWALVGALLAFLLWNWSPAKVFMGDVGSTFLGAVFAGLVLQGLSWQEALSMLLVATPLLGDACLCVLRRLLAGQKVFKPHRLHLFQRLHQSGLPHSRVSGLYIAATTLLAVALVLGGLPWVVALSALEFLIGIWLDQRVAVPFDVASLK